MTGVPLEHPAQDLLRFPKPLLALPHPGESHQREFVLRFRLDHPLERRPRFVQPAHPVERLGERPAHLGVVRVFRRGRFVQGRRLREGLFP